MASRPVALGARLPGYAAAGAVAALLALALGPLLAQAGAGGGDGPWPALRFTLVQAALSAVVSSLAGAVLARALFRRRFWGRGGLISLLSAPFLLPSLAAVMGLLAVFGRGGALNAALAALGLPPVSIFGLGGVVLAHVFLNWPLATRMVLQGWAGIPARRLHLAQSLGFGPWALFWHLEWPMLRAVLPSVLAAVFLICLGSFAVALILGGGPRASTVELAMYQALRFEFDLPAAARLALVQLALGLGAVLLATLAYRPVQFGAGLDAPLAFAGGHGWGRGVDAVVILMAAVFLGAPLAGLAALGLAGIGDLPQGFAAAALRSVALALAAAGLAMAAALALAWARAKGAGLVIELVAMAPLGLSSLALGTGAFLALRPLAAPQALALPLQVALAALGALPFLYRILLPPCRDIAVQYGRLAAQVGLDPLAEWRLVAWPRLARPVGFGMGLAAAMAMGEFGVLALFGAAGQATLPLLVARLMGSYQIGAAAAVTLGLVALSFALFWLFDRWGARRAAI